MSKYIFDTNCFYQIGILEAELLNNDCNEYFCSLVQYNEIKNRAINKKFSEERKEKLLKTYKIIEKKALPTESFILGDPCAGILGKSKLGTSGWHEAIKKKLDDLRLDLNNHNDALIAEIAIQNNIILVTNDNNLIKIMKECFPELIMTLDEFKQKIKDNKNNTKFKQTEIGLIPEDWGTQKIANLCEITSSKRVFLEEYVTTGIPFYRSKEIILLSQNQVITDPLFITEKRFNEIISQFGAPKAGDILMTSVGTLGVPYIVKKNDLFYFKDGNLMWFRAFSEKLHNKFIYYWIKSSDGQNQLNTVAIGSTQKALTIDSLKSTTIPLPPLPEQKAIAKILSDLDSKIELNQQMNKTLEEIGKTLFKRWFVDFEFPNEHGKPYKSSGGEMVYNEELKKEIPKGWGIDRLDKLISRNKIKIENYDFWKDKTIIDLSNMPQKSISLNQWDLGAKFETNIFELNKFDILYGSIRPYFGKAGVSPINGVVTGSVFSFLPKNQNYYSYIVFLISSIDFIEYTVNYSQGTKMPIISWSDFVNYDCVLPADNKLTNEFNIRLYPLINLIVENIQENNTLAQTRDLLLPKLMSGKIRVKYEN